MWKTLKLGEGLQQSPDTLLSSARDSWDTTQGPPASTPLVQEPSFAEGLLLFYLQEEVVSKMKGTTDQ